MSAPPKLVSIVVPAFNEGAGIDRLYSAIVDECSGLSAVGLEIIFIDDGSTDDTLSRLLKLAVKDPRVSVVELSRNFGKEAALTAGIETANGDAVIPMDADLQDPPALIPKLVDHWLQGAEVVLARRSDRSADSMLKRVTARLFYRLHNRVSSISIPENVGDFRLIDRAAVNALKQLPETQRFMKGLFAWIGFKTVVLDYVRPPRSAGSSKFSGWRLWNFALEGLTSFSTAPLKVWTYIGLLGATSTLSYAGYIIARTILHGADVPGYASLMVAVLFLGSLQLISIGMLGEYLGRLYIESKRRPIYVVRRRYGGTVDSK